MESQENNDRRQLELSYDKNTQTIENLILKANCETQLINKVNSNTNTKYLRETELKEFDKLNINRNGIEYKKSLFSLFSKKTKNNCEKLSSDILKKNPSISIHNSEENSYAYKLTKNTVKSFISDSTFKSKLDNNKNLSIKKLNCPFKNANIIKI